MLVEHQMDVGRNRPHSRTSVGTSGVKAGGGGTRAFAGGSSGVRRRGLRLPEPLCVDQPESFKLQKFSGGRITLLTATTPSVAIFGRDNYRLLLATPPSTHLFFELTPATPVLRVAMSPRTATHPSKKEVPGSALKREATDEQLTSASGIVAAIPGPKAVDEKAEVHDITIDKVVLAVESVVAAEVADALEETTISVVAPDTEGRLDKKPDAHQAIPMTEADETQVQESVTAEDPASSTEMTFSSDMYIEAVDGKRPIKDWENGTGSNNPEGEETITTVTINPSFFINDSNGYLFASTDLDLAQPGLYSFKVDGSLKQPYKIESSTRDELPSAIPLELTHNGSRFPLAPAFAFNAWATDEITVFPVPSQQPSTESDQKPLGGDILGKNRILHIEIPERLPDICESRSTTPEAVREAIRHDFLKSSIPLVNVSNLDYRRFSIPCSSDRSVDDLMSVDYDDDTDNEHEEVDPDYEIRERQTRRKRSTQYTGPPRKPGPRPKVYHGLGSPIDGTVLNFESLEKELLAGSSRRLHSSNKKKKGLYGCRHCELKFTTLFNFAKHMDEFNIRRPFLCSDKTCPWSVIGFLKRSEWARHHRNQHAGHPAFECPLCTREFQREDSLKRHVRLVHANPPGEKSSSQNADSKRTVAGTSDDPSSSDNTSPVRKKTRKKKKSLKVQTKKNTTGQAHARSDDTGGALGDDSSC